MLVSIAKDQPVPTTISSRLDMVPNTLMKTYMQDAPLLRERVLKILEDVVVDSAADEESMIPALILDCPSSQQ